MQIEQLLENISDSVVILDHEWTYTSLNHRAELLFRRRASELLGRSYWDVFPDVLGTPAESEFRRAMTDRVSLDVEQFISSIYAWHHVRVIPVDEGLMLISRDITDRARMMRDEAVRAGIRQVVEHLPITVSIMRGPELRFELVNELARAALHGRSKDLRCAPRSRSSRGRDTSSSSRRSTARARRMRERSFRCFSSQSRARR